MSFAGPAVDVGVTMYVLSISSLSEVEMVQKRAEINHDVMADDDDWCRLYVSVQWLYCVASMEGALVRPGQAPSAPLL